MAEEKKNDLAGEYILLNWRMCPVKNDEVAKLERQPPGSKVSLDHDEAERLLAQKVVRKFDPDKDNPPASDTTPEASTPEASSQDAKAAKKAAKKSQKAAKADEQAPPAQDGDPQSTAN